MFGFPVEISPWFFVVVLFGLDYLRIGIAYFVMYIAVLFFSVLVHELGHAFAMRRYGQEPRISLQGYIGLTYGSAPFRSRREDILTSLAGPFTQILLLGVPAWLAYRNLDLRDPLLAFSVYILYFVSFIWGFVNLLPILPLDGGHVAQALWGRPLARRISVVTAVVALVYVVSRGYPIWLIFLLLGAFNAYEV